MNSSREFARRSWLTLIITFCTGLAPVAAENFAVVVGVETCSDETIPSARYACADARAFRGALLSLGLQDRNIRLLTSDDPSRKPTGPNIYNAIKFANGSAPTDRFYFFFSGHGCQLRQNRRSYLVPFEASSDLLAEPEDISKYCLDLDGIVDRIHHTGAGQRLIFIDACQVQPERIFEQGKAVGQTTAQQFSIQPSDSFVFQSCSPGQTSFWSDQHKQGVFTYCLVSALMGAGLRQGAAITSESVRKYLIEQVPKESKSARPSQPAMMPVVSLTTSSFGQLVFRASNSESSPTVSPNGVAQEETPRTTALRRHLIRITGTTLQSQWPGRATSLTGPLFPDVPSNDPDLAWIEFVATQGIIEGFGDGSMHLDDQITREEVAMVIARLSAKLEQQAQASHVSVPKRIALSSSVEKFLRENVRPGYLDGVKACFAIGIWTDPDFFSQSNRSVVVLGEVFNAYTRFWQLSAPVLGDNREVRAKFSTWETVK